MDGFYSLDELTEELVKEYNLNGLRNKPLKPNGTDYCSEYRSCWQQIRRTLIRLGLDKASVKLKNPQTNRKVSCYSSQQRDLLLADQQFYDYLIKTSEDEEIKTRKKYNELNDIIKARRKAHIDFLSQHKNGDYDNTPFITDKEFNEYKLNMMVTAIFEKFFTPIDEDRLFHDLERRLYMDELNLDREDLNVEHRLENPKGSYFKPLD